MLDTPKDLFAALQNTGSEEVTHELYWSFFEVLPPKDIGPNYFIFQEGDGERLYFTQRGDHYYCHLLGYYLVNEDWKVKIHVSRREIDKPFRVICVLSDDETSDVPEEFQDFIGKEFVTISALSALVEAMSMSSEAITFTVDYVGYDSRDYSRDFDDLAEAQREAVSYSEYGCHCITIIDSNGDEHTW